MVVERVCLQVKRPDISRNRMRDQLGIWR